MVTLYLHGQVTTSRSALEAFLRRARVVYEEPGGIRTRLQWRDDEPATFVEIIEYADRATFDADQVRTETDPRMRALLDEWRTHLAGRPRVEVFEEAALT